MFTGLVETTGLLAARRLRRTDQNTKPSKNVRQGNGSLWIEAPIGFTGDVQTGDSICVGGTCLTALDIGPGRFRVDVSAETLRCTTLGRVRTGCRLNLEKALRPSDRLGGHFVTGHVDGLGRVLTREPVGESEQWVFEAPPTLSRMIAAKGSITVEGVSLTVNDIDGVAFSVNLIPHTLAITSLGQLLPGAMVNLEVDLLARYLLRWHETGGPLDDPSNTLGSNLA